MEQFVDKDAWKLGARAIEKNTALAKEGAAVYGAAAIAQVGGASEIDRPAVEGRESLKNAL
jgi:hypothetical protein